MPRKLIFKLGKRGGGGGGVSTRLLFLFTQVCLRVYFHQLSNSQYVSPFGFYILGSNYMLQNECKLGKKIHISISFHAPKTFAT